MTWQEGVLAKLLDAKQDHWFFRGTFGTNGYSSGPANCHSTNLTDPKMTFIPAYTYSDYGYGGETFEAMGSAVLRLSATCQDCGNDETCDLELDQQMDLTGLLDLFERGLTGTQFLEAFRALEIK